VKQIQFDKSEANKAIEWLAKRGGIAVWVNCNMSSQSLGTEVYTPALSEEGKPTSSPGWQYGKTPSRIITDAAEVCVVEYAQHSRVRVIPSKYGPPCDPIKRGREKVDAALKDAGEGSYWQFDWNSRNYGSAWTDCVIYQRTGFSPLGSAVPAVSENLVAVIS